MIRRTPLRRTAALRATRTLRPSGDTGRTPSARQRASQAAQRRAYRDWQDARAVVYARSGGHCEICGRLIAPDAWECHHRRMRSQGGDHRPENLLACCPGPSGCHHRHAHGDRRLAEAAGWIVRSTADPATTPVVVAGRGGVLLTATGYATARGAA